MRRLLLLLALLALPLPAAAQSRPEYVQFTPQTVKGALYRPDAGPLPTVGVLIMHRTGNFLAHTGAARLSARGFLVLAMNPRFDNNEAAVRWEAIALDVGTGVEFLRAQPGIRHVVLFGHSGGGPTMTFYQAVAETGPGYCRGPRKLVECDESLAGLPRADAIVLADAHPGNPVNALRSLHPGVLDEQAPSEIDPALDPFREANGFNPEGPSRYTADFQQRYYAAQAARMNRLIEIAQQRLAAMAAGGPRNADDDVFVVYRGDDARLMDMDPAIHARTERPRKLLRNDGTVVTQIVETVRRPVRASNAENASFRAARLLTLRSFLSANAIRATDALDGIDWCSSNNSTGCALRSISVPLLVAAMGAHYFVRDNEILYEMAASADKDFIVIEGASHGIGPCRPCEAVPGQYANSAGNFFDYAARWIRERFN